jgi:hypothetical protein
MKKVFVSVCWATILMMIFQSCNQSTNQPLEAEWLGSTRQQMVVNIEEQLQGFSRTMVETVYRYQELYWAGMDQNWEYAEYQREHIVEALEQGFVRRPERELSSAAFLNVGLPGIENAIQSADPDAFLEAFTFLTQTCNTCHQMEEVGFMKIVSPTVRHSVVFPGN